MIEKSLDNPRCEFAMGTKPKHQNRANNKTTPRCGEPATVINVEDGRFYCDKHRKEE